ncbi:tetratricopeptide repeat protein [Nitrosomonas sp.]|uniref:tetratricopeptide repeat protein n=1 Tax=Nitrosomonas sp. TaxID=42353 RepID=UPI001D4D449C|nr:tetratricopeptide repeat protein [Nitrosomonas sp.]MCB1947929.1 tetratricopeptide repeat protein [Nitrosomonas sp.]
MQQIWHELLSWWQSLSGTEQKFLGFLVTVMTLIVALISSYGSKFVKRSNTVKQTTNSGDTITGGTHIDRQNNYYGITLEEHEQRLKRRETEIRAELEQAHAAGRRVLETELRAIEQQLQDTAASYQDLIADLTARIAQLETLRGEFADALLDRAIEALQQGETEKADNLFQQIEDEGEGAIKSIAEATFQRGKIAEDAIRYTDALERYENAIRLQPDNALYLNEAGNLHLKFANYKKAIEYFELALAGYIKTHGEDHSNVATIRNNQGSAWHSLGEYQKATNYYEQALASNLKTYGENHPDVALNRNNLGEAYRQLSEYPKSIDYYEQALVTNLKIHGEDHPDVAINRNNLGLAWYALGEHQKAIEYLEPALVTVEQFLGNNHPNTQAARANLDAVRAALNASQKK